jgi:hypothetical protein
MALARRRMRSRLIGRSIAGYYLRSENIQSHVNGSITVAVPSHQLYGSETLDYLQGRVQEILTGLGYSGLVTVRRGTAQGGRATYVTFTSRMLASEALTRYGHTQMDDVLQAVANGTWPVPQYDPESGTVGMPEREEEVVTLTLEDEVEGHDDLMDDFDFPAVELPEMEASEA